jgi:hypothetical protein
MLRVAFVGSLAILFVSLVARTEQPESGFVSLFNGNDLGGWEGDMRFWRVEDGKNRAASGIFAFQLHSGPPMQIKIKNIRVRKL